MHMQISCPLCGNQYDPKEQSACGSCPLHQGCRMVCCPYCGHTTIDPAHADTVKLSTWLLRLFKRPAGNQRATAIEQQLTLADIQEGERVRVSELQHLTISQREQLHSYGVLPGRWVWILQRTPVTVIQVDQTELAFENDIARHIYVML